ncbi:prepilin peptidase [Parachitinimonas caeni]|uniref:A24 family peptidase n=1 Tax=Parachitinimonas caeni TaxID=3031301 RepID=A0ABT7E303_9NEIS|nr:A24 family peptidase [Parachitinimonas caeni]MDK2125693.1 A24 family peptidase [Parachitinimonas caeni]
MFTHANPSLILFFTIHIVGIFFISPIISKFITRRLNQKVIEYYEKHDKKELSNLNLSTGELNFGEQVFLTLVSATTALILYWHKGLNTESIAFSILFAGLILIAAVHTRSGYIPDYITYPLILLGFAYHSYAGDMFIPYLCGAAIGFGLMYILDLLFFSFKRIHILGHGDMKVFAIIGAWTGWLGITLAAILYIPAWISAGILSHYLKKYLNIVASNALVYLLISLVIYSNSI